MTPYRQHCIGIPGRPLSGGAAARGAARATPPPVRARPESHGSDHKHAYRPRKSNLGIVFGMLVAVGAIGVVAMLALLNREEAPSFNELKAQLGVPATGQARMPDLDVVDFDRRLTQIGSKPDGESFAGAYVFLYYTVKEGAAEIILERGPWEIGTARIRQISLR